MRHLAKKRVSIRFFGFLAAFVGVFLIAPVDGVVARSDLFVEKLTDTDITTGNVLRLVNRERVARGLSPLKLDSKLQMAAEKKLADMKRRGYFSHIDPSGNPPWRYLDEIGYSYQRAGENLAVGFRSVGQQHRVWMDSPSHRENILGSEYARTGIAVGYANVRGVSEEIVVVQFFAQKSAVGTEIFADNDPVRQDLFTPAEISLVKNGVLPSVWRWSEVLLFATILVVGAGTFAHVPVTVRKSEKSSKERLFLKKISYRFA